MDTDVTSYNIRFVDKDNAEILLETNLTNTVDSVQDLGVLSNLPNQDITIDIQVKKTGGNTKDRVYIESFEIKYL